MEAFGAICVRLWMNLPWTFIVVLVQYLEKTTPISDYGLQFLRKRVCKCTCPLDSWWIWHLSLKPTLHRLTEVCVCNTSQVSPCLVVFIQGCGFSCSFMNFHFTTVFTAYKKKKPNLYISMFSITYLLVVGFRTTSHLVFRAYFCLYVQRSLLGLLKGK